MIWTTAVWQWTDGYRTHIMHLAIHVGGGDFTFKFHWQSSLGRCREVSCQCVPADRNNATVTGTRSASGSLQRRLPA